MRQEDQPVVGAHRLAVRKFIDVSAALEPKVLEYFERRFNAEAVDVHHAGRFHDMMRVVLLVDADRDTVRLAGELRNGVDDAAVVLLAVVAGHDVQAIADVEQRGEIVLVRGFAVAGFVFLAQLRRHCVDLLLVFVVHGAHNLHLRIRELQVLAGL